MKEEYKYWSLSRPIDMGTYPRKNDVDTFENYDEGKMVDEIGREAWGELIYKSPLSKAEVVNYELGQSKEQEEFVDDILLIEEDIKALKSKNENDENIKNLQEAIDIMKNDRFNIKENTHGEEKNKDNKDKKDKKNTKEEVLKQLKEGIADALDSKKFADWCKQQGKLYYNHYSFTNAMLVSMQNSNATYVMGYEAWKDYGRQVNKGAKGVKILAPTFFKEYSKGGLLALIKKNLMQEFKKNSNLSYANYRLANTKLNFNMYKNGLYDVRIDDNTILPHIPSEELRKFLDQKVIGKMVAYYNVATVFDIADTTDKVEELWVKKCKKEEMIKNENGEPIKNKRGQYKIKNNDERKSKLNIVMDMTIKEQDQDKMAILYDTLRTISKNNGVPVGEGNKLGDSVLRDGALGYYRRPKDGNGKGEIVISSDLELTNKVSVLFHEMAHSKMHMDLEALKDELSKMNNEEVEITRQLKETQAEAVAYMTANNFGIETSNKSFGYIAGWSKGRELKELQQSLDYIYKQSQNLMKEIEQELDNRGLDLQFNAKGDKILTESEINDMIISNKNYYLDSYRENKEMLESALDDLKKPILGVEEAIIKEQIALMQDKNEKLDILNKRTEKITENIPNGEKVELKNKIEAGYKQIADIDNKIEQLNEERVKVVLEYDKVVSEDLKQLYFKNENKFFDKMKTEYKEINSLNDNQLDFIKKSGFIKKYYSNLIGKDTDKFIELSINHLQDFEKVMATSKNNTVVEVNYCERWGEEPLFKKGTLAHPRLMNRAMAEAEKEVRKLKREAEAKNEYYPYSKCGITVFSLDKDKKLVAISTRVDIGDGTQKNLTDHLQNICNNSKGKEILENYQRTLRERGKAIVTEPLEVFQKDDVESDIADYTMGDWKNSLYDNATSKEDTKLNEGKEREE